MKKSTIVYRNLVLFALFAYIKTTKNFHIALRWIFFSHLLAQTSVACFSNRMDFIRLLTNSKKSVSCQKKGKLHLPRGSRV